MEKRWTGTVFPFLSIMFMLALSAWFLAQASAALWFSVPLEDPERLETLSEKNMPGSALAEAPESFSIIETRNLLRARNLSGGKQGPGGRFLSDNPAAESGEGEDVDNLPVSKKGWKLLGTIVEGTDSIPRKASRAVILHEGKQQAYKLGDSVQGWEVALIRRRTVVLTRGNVRERLLIADEAFPSGKTEGDVTVRKTVDRTRLRQELGDIASLMRDIAAEPQHVGGYQGLRITEIRPGSYVQELGLAPGDLLLGVNNRPLKGFGDLGELAELLNTGKITVEVLRNGKKTLIHYDVRS